jgi:hypothetical protein
MGFCCYGGITSGRSKNSACGAFSYSALLSREPQFETTSVGERQHRLQARCSTRLEMAIQERDSFQEVRPLEPGHKTST